MTSPLPRRPFAIVSEMNGKVLDIKGGKATAGSEVIMWIHKSDNSPNQQWYIDHEGFIRSCLNDFALECKGMCTWYNVGL